MSDPREVEDDLRSTAHSIEKDGRRLAALEATKQELESDDPRLEELSDEAVVVAESALAKARAERHLVRVLRRRS